MSNSPSAQDQLNGVHIRTSTPELTDDTSQGYATNDEWINTADGSRWMCDDADSGAWRMQFQWNQKLFWKFSNADSPVDMSTQLFGEHLVIVDCTDGDVEIIIPPSSTSTAKFTFEKIDNRANKGIVNPGGTEQINYEKEQAVILFQYTAFTIESFQSENTWLITSKSK